MVNAGLYAAVTDVSSAEANLRKRSNATQLHILEP